jgi:hypothetical protein
MSTWLIAALCGLALAALAYVTRGGIRRPGALLPAALRALALTVVLALLLDAAAGARRPVRPIVALDVSQSWLRGRDSTAWSDARTRARRQAGDSIFLVGDSVRVGAAPDAPVDGATRIRPAVERALAAGRPLTLLTDGEIDDPDALDGLPSGSRVSVVTGSAGRDAAIVDLQAPRAAVSGDTIEVKIGVVAGPAGASAGTLTVTAGSATIATIAVDSLPAYGERALTVRAQAPSGSGAMLLGAVIRTAGDAEPLDDSLTTVVETSPAAGAVLVSTSPDFDARDALAVLRGALSLPTRGYYRIAPGMWRLEGSFASVAEEEVRRAMRDAPFVVLHGDTAVFGAPRAATRGALALLVPPAERSGDWFAVGAPSSPIAAALSGVPWDSLPPLDVAPDVPALEWEGLEARRSRRFERRIAVAGTERPRRVVIVVASGFWRWRFRGGVSADAFAALWGSIFDWLAAERSDVRVALPADGIVRAGEPVRWRRGTAGGDSAAQVVVVRRGAPARRDSMMLRFPAGTSLAESAPLPPGVYDATVRGGSAILVVNQSRELLPRRPSVQDGAVGHAPSLGDAPRLRSVAWIFVALVGLLCVEWLLRRRLGLR